MEFYDVILTVSIIAAYVLFGTGCAFFGYKKGEENGRLKGAIDVWDETMRIISGPDPLVKTVAWFPTEERSPKKAGRYLVHIKDFAYATDLYYDEKDGFYDEYDDGDRVYYNVMHWAEFPELPDTEDVFQKEARSAPPRRDR